MTRRKKRRVTRKIIAKRFALNTNPKRERKNKNDNCKAFCVPRKRKTQTSNTVHTMEINFKSKYQKKPDRNILPCLQRNIITFFIET